ncbi:MAG: hypothetical protein U0945_12200, partial [Flavobacterium sp.]|nr:hypothetical protein [Flavobacterium sp.]
TTMTDKIMGPYKCTLSESIFIKQKNVNANAPNDALIQILGKRSGAYVEGDNSDNHELNEGLIKRITGEDRITARGLYKDSIAFMSQIKLNFLTNNTPNLSGAKAIFERLIYIFFDQTFNINPKNGQIQEDSKFIEELNTKYISEVFTWIVNGSKQYYSKPKGTREIKMTDKTTERVALLIRLEDSISNFTHKFLTHDTKEGSFVSRKDIFDYYCQYCKSNSQRCKQRAEFFVRLDAMGYAPACLHGMDGFRQIIIAPELFNIISKTNAKEFDDKFDILDLMNSNSKLTTENDKLKLELEQLKILLKNQQPIVNVEKNKVVDIIEHACKVILQNTKSILERPIEETIKLKNKQMEQRTNELWNDIIIDSDDELTNEELANIETKKLVEEEHIQIAEPETIPEITTKKVKKPKAIKQKTFINPDEIEKAIVEKREFVHTESKPEIVKTIKKQIRPKNINIAIDMTNAKKHDPDYEEPEQIIIPKQIQTIPTEKIEQNINELLNNLF